MKLIWTLTVALLLAGCGVSTDGPAPAGDAPTGVAPGVTLYFVDPQQRLRPDQRDTGRLGSIADALGLLLNGPGIGQPDLHTEIAQTSTTRVAVTADPQLIQLVLPLARAEVTPLGIDQIVCTALGVHIQSGGARTTRVRLGFTDRPTTSDGPRACPVLT